MDTRLYAGKHYQALTVHFTPSFVARLLPLFPVVDKKLQSEGTVFLLQETVCAIDHELNRLVQSILTCRYEPAWREHFFDSRAEELLFKFNVAISRDDPLKFPYTAAELEKVVAAEKLICQDITKHFIIRQLSRMVLMNEARFKMVFKNVFDVGPYEYLRKIRLEKAADMIAGGCLVKEAAAATGWRPTDLIVAYRERYGITPGQQKPRK
ncbi:helix-turn-helix transcriptional regulator [Flavihumibacter petaseus]|uniref:Putative AraC family transcriptional regulator n=1 Tax=Flavihumibacter petaseus NBRC 106054 TaxID=1220578 RepID=A0A0E9N2V7_9BACT|nr:helix-turn-helix domain-containing protein [Flavihumibacter petaseus]GAO44118.1 putative AraC family transcriptional regulator [Flavihumibacter petaseus NBRC 106054]